VFALVLLPRYKAIRDHQSCSAECRPMSEGHRPGRRPGHRDPSVGASRQAERCAKPAASRAYLRTQAKGVRSWNPGLTT